MNGKGNRKNYRKNYKPRNTLTPATVAKIARQVSREDKPVRECRFWNSGTPTLTTATLAASFNTMELSIISQGDDLNNRTGSKIYMSGVKIDVTIKNFAPQSRLVRISVVKNRNRAGDLLDTTAWSDIYQGTTYADRTADARILDSQSPLNKDVLEIFYDKVFRVAQTEDTNDSIHFTKYIPINRKFEYGDDGTTNVALSGQLYLILHVIKPDFAAGTSDATDVIAMSRVFFKDA